MEREQLPEAGDRLGQYELIRILGHGGMGVVYEARDGEQRVAVKLLPPDPRLSQEELELDARRMAREFSVLLTLQHPNVVRVLAFGRLGKRPWFAMELVEGQSLEEWADSRPEPVAVSALFRKLASGVGELHRLGLVHRDIKPSNVMVRADGEPVLIDFGIVQSSAAPTLTATRELLGTRRYASPELAAWSRGARRAAFQYTPAYDVHAVGVMLYEALTGKYPFRLPAYDDLGVLTLQAIQRERPRHPSELAPRVPRGLGDLCMRMLAKRPERRPRDGAAVEGALSTLALGGEPAGWKRHARVVLVACLVMAVGRLAVAWAPPLWAARAAPAPRSAAVAVDAPQPPLQPAVLPEMPAMVKTPPMPAVQPAPAPQLSALAPKPAQKVQEPRAVLLAACAVVLGGCYPGAVRDGALAHCPPPSSKPAKRFGVPVGYEFLVTFLDRDKQAIDRGWGPPRVGLEDWGKSPRVLLPTNQPVEMEFTMQMDQAKELGVFDLHHAPFPPFSHVFGLVRQGPKRVEIIFTRLVLKDGSEYPICAVAYDGQSRLGGERGLPTPLPPPSAPPGYLFIDTWEFPAHVLEPF